MKIITNNEACKTRRSWAGKKNLIGKHISAKTSSRWKDSNGVLETSEGVVVFVTYDRVRGMAVVRTAKRSSWLK